MKKNWGMLSAEKLEARCLLAADAGLTPELTDIPEELAGSVVLAASIDGSGNNEANPDWGATDTQLLRLTSVEYADGISEPAGDDRPSAREISNVVADQSESLTNDRYLTDFVWLWGQFIDHDIDLTEAADPAEAFDIEVPTGDVDFDPLATGSVTIGLNRSNYDETTSDSTDDPRQQINEITAYLDGSVTYGSDDERAAALRTFDGGQLKTSEGDLLPFNEEGFDNAGGTSEELFLAGDVRANENAALSAMHTLWIREHNRLADEIAAADPGLSDDQIYQQARAIVVAQMQAITYNQWLPALLGVDAISDYEGYDPTVNAGIANVFSTAAYRFGHSMLSTELLRLDNDGNVIDGGNLSLSEAFFAPQELVEQGIDSLLLGAASQLAQEVDTMVVDDVRNFLFGPPGAGGFDLAALNIQRGRDHGLADYNQARVDLGLEPVASFAEITSDTELASRLEQLYGDVNNIDVWVGGLAEDHVAGASVGEFVRTVLVDQFERIRDGDSFWYENTFSGQQLLDLQNTTLSDVILRNTEITELRENVFYDESVLVYASQAGSGPASVTVVANDRTLEVVDQRTGNVLQSLPVNEVNKVVLVGTRAAGDSFTIDPSLDRVNLPGGIVVDAQAGGRDRLVVRGSAAMDAIAVDGALVTMNDTELQVDGVEQLRLDTGPGPDDVDIVDGSLVDIVLDGDGRGQQRSRGFRPARRAVTPPAGPEGPPPVGAQQLTRQAFDRDGEPDDDARRRRPAPHNMPRIPELPLEVSDAARPTDIAALDAAVAGMRWRPRR